MSKPDDSSSQEKTIVLKDEEKILLDHDYDGIQELDHPLPNWWLWLFYATIFFSIGYAGYYLTGIGPTTQQELAAAMKGIETTKAAVQAAAPGISRDIILASVKDESRLKKGAAVFTGKCAACHGPKGEGLIGPNLTDDSWLHGKGEPQDIAVVIRDGVAEKGMPPWGPLLSEEDLIDVTAFVRSIHGSNPPGAKEPQGPSYDFQSM